MALLAIGKKKSAEPAKPLMQVAADQIILAASAIDRIQHLLRDEPKGSLLRVGIIGGGCSGFSYQYAIEAHFKPNDLIFGDDRARICVDPKSLKLIGGSVLQWNDEMGRSGFQLDNERSRKSCSCGQSFAL